MSDINTVKHLFSSKKGCFMFDVIAFSKLNDKFNEYDRIAKK